jgi:hypothetical protein
MRRVSFDLSSNAVWSEKFIDEYHRKSGVFNLLKESSEILEVESDWTSGGYWSVAKYNIYNIIIYEGYEEIILPKELFEI